MKRPMRANPKERLRLGLFYRYFFSYVSLVAVVLGVISVFIVGVFLRDFEQKARANSADKLYEIRQITDLRLERLAHSLVTQVALDPRLTPLHLGGSVAAAYGVTAILNDYRIHDPEVFDVALYYSGDSVVYSGDGTYARGDFFARHFMYDGVPAAVMERAIVSPPAGKLLGARTVSVDNGLRIPLLTYIYPVPISSTDTLTIILFIDAGQFAAPIEDFSRSTPGELLLFDHAGDPIYVHVRGNGLNLDGRNLSDVESIVRNTKDHAGSESNLTRARLGGTQYAVMTIRSKGADLVYCLVTPESEYTHDVRGVATTIGVAIGSIFILGLALAFMLSRKQYAPFARLRRMLSVPVTRSRALLSRRDEIESLEENLGLVITQNRELIARVEQGDRYANDRLFLRLLSGDSGNVPGSVDSFLRSCRIEHGPYTVVCIFRDHAETDPDSAATQMDEILVTLEQSAASLGGGYGVCLPDGHLAIVLAGVPRDHDGVLERFVRSAQRLIQEHYRMMCTIAVGETSATISGLHASYMTSRTAALHRFQLGRGRIIQHRDIAPQDDVPTFIALKNQEQLERVLRQADATEAARACRTVFEEISQKHLPIDAAMYLANSLLATVLRIVEEMHIPLGEFLRGKQSDRILLVGHFQTIQDFRNYVLSLIEYVCSSLSERGTSKRPAIYEKIIRYLENHITDPQIGMKQLAYDLGVSASYAARLFREQTGMTIMSWVDDQRMTICKSLLVETTLTLDEILIRAGYSDKTNFVRKFRRATGVTPMRFRSLQLVPSTTK